MSFMKKNTYQMDIDRANSTLQNIFAACDQAPNTIPFDKLVLRQKVNTRIYNRLLVITAAVFLLTFLSPLIIVPVSNMMEHLLAPTPVVLLNDYREGDILYLQLAGDHILYEEAYLETISGERYYAVSYDAAKQLIAFPYIEDSEANIYIPIKDNEPLHFLLSPK
uniref:hypothetical protein n=1 Tax=Acetatifactor sp. TaxID=1872090 RepID=UPI004055BBF1